MDARKLKEKATEAFAKGKFAKAAELYQEYCDADPKDLQSRLRMGDAWAKAGVKEKAIGAYKLAAEGFAKEGFLPRAIAASKLIVELDPSHKGVQTMLAELYARRGTPADAKPKRPANVVAAPAAAEPLVTSNRPEAIVPPPPSPFTRKDAIELPPDDGADIPLDVPLTRSVVIPPAPPPPAPAPAVVAQPEKRSPPPDQSGPRVIEIEEEPADGVALGVELSLDGGGEPEPAAPIAAKAPAAPAPELELSIDESEDVDFDVDASDGDEEPVAPAAAAGPKVIDLSADLPPELDLEMAGTAALEAVEAAASAPGPQATPKAELAAVTVPGARAEVALPGHPLVPPAPAIPTSASATGGAPPGLKPRRSGADTAPVDTASPEPEEPILELTVKKPEPAPAAVPLPAPAAAAVPLPAPAAGGSASRIWLPTGFPGAQAAAAAPEPALPATGLGGNWGDETRNRPRTDLERGLEALSRFDELDLEMSPPSKPPMPPPGPAPVEAPAPRANVVAPPAAAPTVAPAVAPVVAPAVAPIAAKAPRAPSAPAAPARTGGRPAGVPSFTELELEGDSLLHAVEMAAMAGAHLRGEAQDHQEESMAEEAGGEATMPSGLPKIPLFSDLSPDAFIELFERCPLLRFEMGQRIIEQGSLGDSFFVICAGSVKVVREDGGARRELATLNEGAFFGEMALLSGAPRTASVESDTDDTQLLEISAQVLAELSHRYPPVAQALKKFCRQRLLANVMNTSRLFQPFNKKDRKSLVERFRARDVSKGDVIIREGKFSDGLYVLLSGEVEVKKGTTGLAQLKEGEVFGEMSLLNKAPASATVAASKRTSLLRLPREDFDAIILTHPQVLALISELNENRSRKNAALLERGATDDSGEMLV